MEVYIANIKGGMQHRLLNDFITETLARLKKGKRVGSHVIQKKKSGIDTTVLYFDIDKFKGDINNHIEDLSKYLAEYYQDLDHLILKSKGFNKYHIYFVNIFVSEPTLSFLVRNFNQKYGCKLLDEACIKNFIRMEGSSKYDPKTKKYAKNSEYYILNSTLNWEEIYNKLYRFNEVETETKKPISTIKQDKKIKKVTAKPVLNPEPISDKLNNLLSAEFGKYTWNYEFVSDTSVKLVNDNKQCLVNPTHQHSSINHSCIFINQKGSNYRSCHSHGKAKIPITKNIQQIKQILGLAKQQQNEGDLNDFQSLCERVLDDGQDRHLKKLNGYIYEPQPYSPIVYKRGVTYQEYLNKLYSNKSHPTYNIFRKSSTTMSKMLTYMTEYDDIEFSFLKTNRHIFSFCNGYLDISDLFDIKFTFWDNLPLDHNIATTVHYDIEFDMQWLKGDGLETPIFDQIVMNHLNEFEDENDNMLYEIFCGMIGRLHYDLNKYDRFNCMLYILGYANTGKSTIAEFILSNHASYGNIEGNEKVFGLQSCVDKPLAYNGDVRIDFHQYMDKAQLQKIIEGARVDIPIKNQPSINDYTWTAPLFFVSNFPLGYKDNSNAIARRLCIFTFDSFIENRDASLRDQMFTNERPLLLIKSLLKYQNLVKLHSNKTFQDWPYKYLKDNTMKQQTKSDYVYAFCNLAPGSFKYWPVYEEGCVLTKDKFKEYIEFYVYLKHTKNYRYTHNKNALKALGFDCKDKKICGNCGKEPTGARKRENQCCMKYNKRNRRNLPLILNMKLLKMNKFGKVVDYKRKCDIDYESDSDEE